MIFLRTPPLSGFHNLSSNLSLVPLLIHGIGDLSRCLVLFIIMVEDRGSVLGTHVGSLPVRCGGVVHTVEELEEGFVGSLGRIKEDLNCLGIYAGSAM